jgi:hypothetical protein
VSEWVTKWVTRTASRYCQERTWPILCPPNLYYLASSDRPTIWDSTKKRVWTDPQCNPRSHCRRCRSCFAVLCEKVTHCARPLLLLLHTFSWALKFCANSCRCIFLFSHLVFFVFLAANCLVIDLNLSIGKHSVNVFPVFPFLFFYPPLSEAALLSGAWSSCSYNKSLLSFLFLFPFEICSFVSSWVYSSSSSLIPTPWVSEWVKWVFLYSNFAY